MRKNSQILFGFVFFTSVLQACKEEAPILQTLPVIDITVNSATSGGTITFSGSSSIIERGISWSNMASPTVEIGRTVEGSGIGTFISYLRNLDPQSSYSVRAYATNSTGTYFGNEETFVTVASVTIHGDQIIADHTVVDKYDDIPQQYIDQVKKMWLSVPGRSHAEGYRVGLETLENINPRYAVNVTLSGTPESYTTSYLRANSAHWGDYDTPTGWSHDYYYFWDWYHYAEGVAQTKVGISYAHSHNLTIGAYGFAWCYDEGTTDATGYINATQSYVDYCTSNSIPTKVFFTTGPLDGFIGEGEYGYMNYLRYEQIRDYVSANPSAILFDYADIISYNNDGVQYTTTWDGHTFPAMAPDLIGEDGAGGHISGMATLRLAKAMWWMLARIAGWDGN